MPSTSSRSRPSLPDDAVEPPSSSPAVEGALVERDGVEPQPVLGIREDAADHLLGGLVDGMHDAD